jgi:hypothetical protein
LDPRAARRHGGRMARGQVAGVETAGRYGERRQVIELGTVRGEMVEKELDAMIERRSRKGERDPDTEEALYAESVRRHHEAIKRENRAGWYGHHTHMSDLHARLSREHEAKARALLEEDAV